MHVIPVADVEGALLLCGLGAIALDPAAALASVDGDAVVCLQPDAELAVHAPGYVAWLAGPGASRAIRLSVPDNGVAADDDVVAVVTDIHARMRRGERIVVHCASGRGRAGVIAALVMCAAGADVDQALRAVRLARPGAGPQCADQDLQIGRLAPRVRSVSLER